MIKTGDICCTANSKIGPTVAACNTTITLHLNYFPTSSSYKYGDTPYTRASGTFKLDPSTATLPDSLAVKIKCGNGTYSGGTLSATTIMSALANKKMLNGLVKYMTKAVHFLVKIWYGLQIVVRLLPSMV